jgi:hypothetical protein
MDRPSVLVAVEHFLHTDAGLAFKDAHPDLVVPPAPPKIEKVLDLCIGTLPAANLQPVWFMIGRW